jgi:hypothetical protein
MTGKDEREGRGSAAQFSNALPAVKTLKTESTFVGISGKSEICH